MSIKLVESNVEKAAIEWLLELGYNYELGSDIERPLKQVVFDDQLYSFLKRRYPRIPDRIIKEAVSRFINNEGLELDNRNHDFHLKLSKGIDLTWKDNKGEDHFEHIYCIDYENPENNTFTAINQFTIEGKNHRRPDLIVFINGLPVVLFEFKNMFDENTTVDDAFNQIQHYKLDIPAVFEYNAVTVISDGLSTLHGMYSSDMEWFTQWKSIDGVNVVEDGFELESLLKGLFPKGRLVNYIRNFVFHEDHNGKLIKKGAKYHQFFSVLFAVESTKKALKPEGDGRIGVVWHTQGSGKSISMAIFTGILRKMPELRNPTIVVQVDRRDLDNQLFDNFRLARDLVGDIDQAQSTDDLRELLNTEGGGVVFSTIEKFRIQKEKGEYEHPVLSDKNNIVVIADEAHRTQYGLLDGLAANLRIALPNASFIGYTGTPVDKKDADTVEVFGNLIHVYDIKQAVDDKATVPLYYEPRLAKLHLSNEGIDEEAEEIAGEEQETETHLKWAALEDAAGSEERVEKIAKDILAHYLKRTSILAGKVMIVCMSRRNCVKLYDAITSLPDCPETAVVMTGNIAKDPPEWNPHIRTKEAMEGIKQRFKNPDDPLKIVIVRDMWLTGFDNPSLHAMYVDKVMHDHNLMQAIARVNRIFRDKPSGLIVDYIGIGTRLRDATTKYTRSGGKGTPTEVIERALSLFYDQLEVVKALLPLGLDYSAWRRLSDGDKLKLISSAVNHIVKDDETTDRFLQEEKKLASLLTIVMAREEIRSYAVDIAFIQHTTVAVKKIKYPQVGIKKKEQQIKELISRSIDSEDIVDVYATAGLEKPDISILDDTFLTGAKQSKEGSAIKVELLRQLLKNEINARLSRNIHKYRSLKEEVEKVIERYHKNAIDSFTAIAELVNQAKEIQNEDKRASELGLSEEELAFYDIIAHHEGAIKEHDRIKEIVHNVVKAVTKNLQLDWYKKENAKAAIRLAVKKELRGKVKISELNDIMAEIIEQAEGQYKDWPNQMAG